MAKGTGYSSYSHKGWDIKAYQAAQKEKDKQIQVRLISIGKGYIDKFVHVYNPQLVLEKICGELKRLYSITTVQAR